MIPTLMAHDSAGCVAVSGDLVISVVDLQAALARISESLGDEVELSTDHYWLVPTGRLPATGEAPALDVGQVSDDIESVAELLARPAGDVHVWHDLAHLAGVLRVIADEATRS